jgi:hypothetical protein
MKLLCNWKILQLQTYPHNTTLPTQLINSPHNFLFFIFSQLGPRSLIKMMQHSIYLININPNQNLSKIKSHFGAPIPMGIFFPTTNSICLESPKHPTHDNWLVIWLLLKALGFFITSLILTPIIYFWISIPSIKVHVSTKIQLHKDLRYSNKGHSSPIH